METEELMTTLSGWPTIHQLVLIVRIREHDAAPVLDEFRIGRLRPAALDVDEVARVDALPEAGVGRVQSQVALVQAALVAHALAWLAGIFGCGISADEIGANL